MIALHTVYVVTLISQTTSALILWLLVAGDRRSRGLTPLATACTLHTAAIFLMPMWRGSNRWVPEAISAAILPVMFLWIYRGLSQLTGRPGKVPLPALTVVVACSALAAALAPWSRLWSIQIAWLTAIAIMACTVKVLWRPGNAALCVTARLTAVCLSAILVTFILRLPLEPHSASSPLMVLLRELTMVEITLLAFSFLAVYLAESQRRMYNETRLDPLTGLLNRRAMEEGAADQLRLAERTGRPVALLMMDLDSFKLLNDTWGHSVGDRALQAVGATLIATAPRRGALIARLGGEEFAVLLPASSLTDAGKLAERLRSVIACISLPEGTRHVTFTVSVGVAAWHAGETSWTEMLRRADLAMYRAKRGGRNRVMLCDEQKTDKEEDHYPAAKRTRSRAPSLTTEPADSEARNITPEESPA